MLVFLLTTTKVYFLRSLLTTNNSCFHGYSTCLLLHSIFFFKFSGFGLRFIFIKQCFLNTSSNHKLNYTFRFYYFFFNWGLIVGWLQHCLELFCESCSSISVSNTLWSSLNVAECTSFLRVTPVFMSFSVSSKCIVDPLDFSSPYCQNYFYIFFYMVSFMTTRKCFYNNFASKYTIKCCAKETHWLSNLYLRMESIRLAKLEIMQAWKQSHIS